LYAVRHFFENKILENIRRKRGGRKSYIVAVTRLKTPSIDRLKKYVLSFSNTYGRRRKREEKIYQAWFQDFLTPFSHSALVWLSPHLKENKRKAETMTRMEREKGTRWISSTLHPLVFRTHRFLSQYALACV
jgi:hypothetical protein